MLSPSSSDIPSAVCCSNVPSVRRQPAKSLRAEIYSQEAAALPSGSAEAAEKLALVAAATDARADLVLFINPAGAATEAKPMLDFLIDNSYRYQPFLRGRLSEMELPQTMPPIGRSLSRSPQPAIWLPRLRFLSAMLCRRSALKRRASFRDLGSGLNGNYGLSCYDPHEPHPHWHLKTKQDGAVPQSSFYLNTAPHMQVLQSHVMLKASAQREMQVASTGQKITIPQSGGDRAV